MTGEGEGGQRAGLVRVASAVSVASAHRVEEAIEVERGHPVDVARPIVVRRLPRICIVLRTRLLVLSAVASRLDALYGEPRRQVVVEIVFFVEAEEARRRRVPKRLDEPLDLGHAADRLPALARLAVR